MQSKGLSAVALGMSVAALCGCNGQVAGRATPGASTANTVAKPASSSVAALPAVAGPDRFAYVGTRGSFGVPPSVYSIDPVTGVLAPVGTDSALDDANAITADPGRHFLVELLGDAPGSGAVTVFQPDPRGGPSVQVSANLLPGSGLQPRSMQFVGADRLFITEGDGGVAAYEFAPQTGATRLLGSLSPPGPGAQFTEILSVAAVGSFVYETWADFRQGTPLGPNGFVLGPRDPSTLRVARLDAGGLTQVSETASPLAQYLYPHPSGRFVYVSSANGAAPATVDPATGALVIGTPLAFAAVPGLVFAPSGRFAYAHWQDATAPYEWHQAVLSVDPATGALAVLSSTTFAGSLVSFNIDASGSFAYLSLDVTPPSAAPPPAIECAIQAYRIDASGGLTASGQPLRTALQYQVALLATRR